MFLFNSLCKYFEYFAMNASFRISLLHILLLIPQHGNSPLPVMQSWLQKDQDDGYVQRDMTSSFTGDESFGSAHQTYQNSLIRKKKSDNSGNKLPNTGYRKFTSRADRNERYEQPDIFFDSRYLNNDYNAQVSDNEGDNGIFEEFDKDSGSPSDKYGLRSSNPRGENINLRTINKFNRDKYSNIIPYKDAMFYKDQMNNIRPDSLSLNPIAEDMGRSAKWSLCKRLKQRYASNPPMEFSYSMPMNVKSNFDSEKEVSLQSYPGINDDRRGREIQNQDLVQVKKPEEKSPQIFDDNEYYEVEANPVSGQEDLNGDESDYNQMLSQHGIIHKRDETRQQKGSPKSRDIKESSETNKVVVNNLKSNNQPVGLMNDAVSLEAMKKDIANLEMDKNREPDNSNLKNEPNSNLEWKMNSNAQTKALHDVMKNSQRALQEVQLLQQKMSLKSPEGNENGDFKRESRNQPLMNCEKNKVKFDDKRLKREDEDEQKNMKTGTDEGGGGEYEDEEGKGHKDEEEYYEDADLSDDESRNKIRTTDDLNQKYFKREIPDAHLKNPKEAQNEKNSQDYELNFENAPVENSEKSKKASFQGDGEKTKKNSVRKGVKIWDQWGKWSPCSVTCGIGRSTRWRHCISGGCAQGEKEAQIKRCTNPAC